MKNRLEALRTLMREDGSIWINIDDGESHYLKVLCDEVFGRENFVASLPVVLNLKGNQDQYGFAGTHEYILVFAKNRKKCNFYEFDVSDDDLDDWEEDEIGYFKKGATLKATGEDSLRADRPYMFYPILVKEDVITTIKEEEHGKIYNKIEKTFDDEYLDSLIQHYKNEGWEIVLPYADENNFGRWRWGFNQENQHRLENEVIVSRTNNGISLYKKQRPSLGELPTQKPKSIFYKPEYSSGNGTAQVKKLFVFLTFCSNRLCQ
jgi:adenine-specific DNA-methyltransferase